MTNEERSQVYYSNQELKLLNMEAHAITTLSQDLPEIVNGGTYLREKDRRNSGSTIFTATATILNTKQRDSRLGLNDEGTTTPTSTTSNATNNTNNDSKKGTVIVDTLRGLELIMFPKRKRNKMLALCSLLKYQQLLKSKPHLSTERREQALAMASVKLNLWSTKVAIETARLDALRAYEGCDYFPIEPLTSVKDDESEMMQMKQPFSSFKKKTMAEENYEVVGKQYHHQKQHQQLKRKYGRSNSFRRVTYDNKDSRNDESVNSHGRRSTPALELSMANTIINYYAIFQHESESKRRKMR
jgi:hypothetical protein